MSWNKSDFSSSFRYSRLHETKSDSYDFHDVFNIDFINSENRELFSNFQINKSWYCGYWNSDFNIEIIYNKRVKIEEIQNMMFLF